MRRVAGSLTALVAVAQLGLFLVAQQQLQATPQGLGPTLDATWLRWSWAVVWAAPWVVATLLFAVGSTRRAVAVTLTSALLVTTTGLASLAGLTSRRPVAATDPWTVWVAELGGAAVWLLAAAAGIAVWLVRPRGDWRRGAPGPVGWYVTVAVLAWLPAAFRATQFAPPGAQRPFVETAASQLTGLDALATVAGAVLVGLLLFVAPRLRPDIAGTVLLTYAIPTLLGDLGRVLRVVTGENVIFTPSGALGLVGIVGLVIAGAVWVRRRPVAPSHEAGP